MSQLKYDTSVSDNDRDVAGAILRAGATELSATGTSLDVRNTTAEGILTTIDADTGSLVTEQAAQGLTLDSILTDTNAMVVDLAAIEAELLDQGTTLDSIETEQASQGTAIDSILTDTNAMVVDLAAIEAELLDQGTTLDTIEGDTTSIDSTLTALSFAGQSTYGATNEGITMHGVRNDTLADLSGGDGQRAPFQFNATGALYVDQGSATDPARANTAAVADKKSVTTTSGIILSGVPLTDRKRLYIANEGNRKMYISTGTATADDFPISDGKMLELNVGPAIVFTAVTASGTADCRTLQLS